MPTFITYASYSQAGIKGIVDKPTDCQSAFNFDPASASNFDPLQARVLMVALAPSELAGVAETVRARVV